MVAYLHTFENRGSTPGIESLLYQAALRLSLPVHTIEIEILYEYRQVGCSLQRIPRHLRPAQNE